MDEPEPDGRRRTVSGGPLDGKPFAVTGYEVWRAWEQVRDNKGAPGADGQSIAAFEERLEDNLYKVWNRMSAGSCMPLRRSRLRRRQTVAARKKKAAAG
jgi:hypothetical protein